ncbi:hypothetical protein Hanom_Chr07g00581591 [Helianthus anomalus]
MSDKTNDMDSQNDVFWAESVHNSKSVDKCTWMVYVSFGSLRQSVWWDQTYKALSFDTEEWCKGFGVRLVEKKSRSGIKETPTICSSGNTPTLDIQHDSTSALSMHFSVPDTLKDEVY